MNKEEFTLLENIKRLDNDMQKEIKVKETKIKILEAEIEQQRLANLESKSEK